MSDQEDFLGFDLSPSNLPAATPLLQPPPAPPAEPPLQMLPAATPLQPPPAPPARTPLQPAPPAAIPPQPQPAPPAATPLQPQPAPSAAPQRPPPGFGESSSIYNIKLPPFWAAEPDLWFFNVEAQFELNGVTRDATKMAHLLAALDPSNLSEISDVLRDPSKTYDKIKKSILERFGESEEKKLSRLLGPLELGDRKPSQLLREIQNLAGPSLPKNMLRSLWLKKLPAATQQILQVSSTDDLSKLSEMADKIQSIQTTQPAYIHKVSAPPQHELQQLREQINSLQEKLDRLLSERPAPYRSHRPRSRSSSRSHERGICFYHNKFGDKAEKCAPPCSFKAGNAKPPSV